MKRISIEDILNQRRAEDLRELFGIHDCEFEDKILLIYAGDSKQLKSIETAS